MEDSGNSFNVYDTNGLPLWEDPQHECCVWDQTNVDGLRRSIKYFFMNPCEKYHARGRKPWKLLLQLVKIAIITVQVVFYRHGLESNFAVMHVDTFLFYSTFISARVLWTEQPDGGHI